MLIQLNAIGESKHVELLSPIANLLENFNYIVAEQDNTDTQQFDIIAYMQKIITLYQFEFDQSDINFNYSGEKSLTLDSVPSYIVLIFLNIINNSLKHGFDNNGQGTISLLIEKGEQGGAIITYTDDGKGMDNSTLSRVFEPFFTTCSDRGYVGVGMSSIYDLITHKLNGDINLVSEVSKGTTITINLP